MDTLIPCFQKRLGRTTMKNTPCNFSPDDWMTPKEVAAYWRLSVDTIYGWVHEGRIPYRRFSGKGGAIRIPFSAFDPSYLTPKDDPRKGLFDRLPGKAPSWMRP